MKEELKDRIQKTIQNHFENDNLPEEINSLIENIKYYWKFRQISQSSELVEIFESKIAKSPDQESLKSILNETQSEYTGLQIFKELVESNQNDILERACSSFFVQKEDFQIFQILFSHYSEIKKIINLEELEFHHNVKDDDLTTEVILEYLHKLKYYGLWQNQTLEDEFFKENELANLNTTLLDPSQLFDVFLDSEHYLKIFEEAKSNNDRLKQNLAYTFYFFSSLINKGPKFLEASKDDLLNNLDELGDLTPAETDRLTPHLMHFFSIMKGTMFMFAGISKAPNSSEYFQKSHLILWNTGDPMAQFQSLLPLYLINKSDDSIDRIKLQEIVSSKINELLADCTLIEDPAQRFMLMALVTLHLPIWKADEGDFKSAIDYSLQAQAYAQKGLEIAGYQKDEIFRQMENDFANSSDDEDEQRELDKLRNIILLGYKGYKSVLNIARLQYLTYKARLAESSGDFESASGFYNEASKEQEELIEFIHDLIANLFKFIEDFDFNDQEAISNKAKAIFYRSLAIQAKGDNFLMNMDFKNALKQYSDSLVELSESIQLWKKSLDNDTKSSESQNWYDKALLKKRFLELKSQQVIAEQNLYINNYSHASKLFLENNLQYRELLISYGIDLKRRDIMLIKAARDYCEGRALLTDEELPTNFDKGINYLTSSSDLYFQSNEHMWGSVVLGLKNEYEAKYYSYLSKKSTNHERLVYENLSKDKLKEAISIYKRNNLQNRAEELETLLTKTNVSFAVGLVVPPQILDASPEKSKLEEHLIIKSNQMRETMEENMDTTEKRIRKLLAEAQAISEFLNDKRDSAGITMTEEEFMVKFIKLKSRKNLIMSELQGIVKGYDQDFDNLIIEAVKENNPEIIQKNLIKFAEKKGWGESFIESINQNKDKIVEFVVKTGMQVINSSTT